MFAKEKKGEGLVKVKIEIEPNLDETEVVIRCGQLDESIVNLQNYITQQSGGERHLRLCRGDTEYYVSVKEIYFFETEGKTIQAHTAEHIFETDYKLYELEEVLPGSFMRISKSTIVNLDYIYSITRNLTASSVVEFKGSSKKALVSRSYYKALTERLRTRRLGSN